MSTEDRTPDEPDEFTPHQRGMLLGAKVAESVGRGDLQAYNEEGVAIDLLTAMAGGPPHIPENMRRWIMGPPVGMAERLAASEDPDAEDAFWAGFGEGVRAYIVQTRIGATEN
jgi:hypothetical protein